MLSLLLHWSTVVMSKKPHVAASTSLEALCVRTNSVTVWLVVVRKASLLKGKACGSTRFVDYQLKQVLTLCDCRPSFQAATLYYNLLDSSTIQSFWTWFQSQHLLLQELFRLLQQSINTAAGKACALDFFTYVKVSQLATLAAVTWIACLHDRGCWAANTNSLLKYWFCWMSSSSSPPLTSQHTWSEITLSRIYRKLYRFHTIQTFTFTMKTKKVIFFLKPLL